MAVFPEHIHIENEDRLLKRAETADRYRHMMDELLGAFMIAAVVLIAAIAALALI
ncbi:MAG TPA: hypothetical protein VFL73_12460 [Solirubrobacteraceae bacterium]|jgi:phosphatidylglycerophosphatase A|nr:hypothetical protein [Solirubrobacteraceae bacterium]